MQWSANDAVYYCVLQKIYNFLSLHWCNSLQNPHLVWMCLKSANSSRALNRGSCRSISYDKTIFSHWSLKRVPEAIRSFGSERRNHRRRRRPKVWPQGQGVHPVNADESHPDERSQSWCEYGAGLNDEGEDCPHQDREVSGQPRHVRNISVQRLLDHFSDCAWFGTNV